MDRPYPDDYYTYMEAIGDDIEKMATLLGWFWFRNAPFYSYDNADHRDAISHARASLLDVVRNGEGDAA